MQAPALSRSAEVVRGHGRQGLRGTVLRYLLMLPGLFMVSLAMVAVGPVGPAAAATGTYSPVEVGKTVLKSPPGKVITTVGSMTPWGRALKLGMLAYATHDAWWPVARSWLGGDEPGAEDVSGGEATIVTHMSVTARHDTAANGITGEWVDSSTGLGNLSIRVWDVKCLTSSTVVDGTGFYQLVVAGVAYGPRSGSYSYPNICPSGTTIMQARVHLYDSYSSDTMSQGVLVTGSYPDSMVTNTVEVQCRQPDGSLVTISETVTGEGDRVYVPSCADRVPGSIPWSGTIKSGPNATTQKELTSWTTDQDAFGEYADCFGPSGLECVIRVYVDGNPCVVGEGACTYWKRLLDDPLTKDRVQCRFGSHVIDVRDCYELEHAYKEKTKVKTVTEVKPDGEADTDTDPDPKPPQPPPPNPTQGPNPTTPIPDPDGETDPDSQSCFGEAWSLNPVDWVYVPVKCAFLWAFKPSPGYMDARVGELQTTWNGTSPALYADEIEGMIEVPTMDGCEGILVEPPGVGSSDTPMFSERLGEACSGTAASIASKVKLGISALIVVFGSLSVLRNVVQGVYPPAGSWAGRIYDT